MRKLEDLVRTAIWPGEPGGANEKLAIEAAPRVVALLEANGALASAERERVCAASWTSSRPTSSLRGDWREGWEAAVAKVREAIES